MRRAGLALLAAAGCAATGDPYAVDAIARIAPVPGAGVAIRGDLQVLAPATPIHTIDYQRTFAAYKIELPDGAAPWVRILRAASCDPTAKRPGLLGDLGAIRRVGDETHFFARDIRIGDGTRDIDIQTVTTAASLDPAEFYYYLIGTVAVIQAPGDPGAVPEPMPERYDCAPEEGPICPDVTWAGYFAGGPWLACGVLETF